MLPLECPYLNKTALFTVVGQQVTLISFRAKMEPVTLYPIDSALSVPPHQTFHIKEETQVSGAACRAFAEIHRRPK